MNKNVLLLIGLLSIAFSVNAQSWSIGDKVYVGHSWTVGNRPKNSSNMKYAFHPSFQVGRNAVYHFNPFVSFGLGTFFSTEGVGFKLDGVSPDTRLEQRMNYIRVPVFTNITFGAPKSRLRGRLGLGGSVGFLVGGRLSDP